MADNNETAPDTGLCATAVRLNATSAVVMLIGFGSSVTNKAKLSFYHQLLYCFNSGSGLDEQ